ncbi:hypothetical protein [Parasphingorhabdus sp.]|uniref:hypothetical protein n=1 Tax=Parasphingorhabdus sp. TaxID=2709688 RepID=UPI0032975742
MTKSFFTFFTALCSMAVFAQNTTNYWQQHVDYTMAVDMDVDNFRYTGTQKLVYTNNSPDELKRVYFHMYFNAFQPGSEMDIRLQNIADPDGRMTTADKKSRIALLAESEQGYLHATSLTQDGSEVSFSEEGTILVVDLAKPIPAGAMSTFNMEFKGQVPLQIRRSGRNSEEGVALSMSQWYPKLAEYDFEGWHADPNALRNHISAGPDSNIAAPKASKTNAPTDCEATARVSKIAATILRAVRWVSTEACFALQIAINAAQHIQSPY